MSLTIFNTDNKDMLLMETSWASQLNPVLSNPIIQGVLQKNITLSAGTNIINHKLGRTIQGYIITGMHGAYSQIYDTNSTTPALTILLNSSVTTTIDIYCF